jgi:L-arabinose transport system substrate-binding protein
MIGVGIGGADSAINEFKKPTATGFFGTVIISPKRHGYETALNMYEWVANGKEPEKLILTAGQACQARRLSKPSARTLASSNHPLH